MSISINILYIQLFQIFNNFLNINNKLLLLLRSIYMDPKISKRKLKKKI